jgi:hypothetical protein
MECDSWKINCIMKVKEVSDEWGSRGKDATRIPLSNEAKAL